MGIRMYSFVMYNLSGIQKGIQSAHSMLEYVLQHGKNDPLLWEFIRDHKTVILLSGGGSMDMVDRLRELEELGITHSYFREPDLNDSISSISFLVKEEDYADEDIYGTNPITQYLKKFRLA